MKMFYGNIPVNSMKIKHYELSTSDATVQPSDLQSGITCYARGKKVTGTGKAFEFAMYGKAYTNTQLFSPSIINIIKISCLDYPVKSSMGLNVMGGTDFSSIQTIGYVIIDDIEYPITAQVNGDILTLFCEKTIELQYFYGKDLYV